MFCRSDTFGFNGEILSVCTPEDGLNLVGLFSLKFRLGLSSVDVNGFDSIGACPSPLCISPNSGPACDVSGEGWNVEEYLGFTFLVPGTKTKPRISIRTIQTTYKVFEISSRTFFGLASLPGVAAIYLVALCYERNK